MSFSSDIKAELAKTVNQPRHCQIAELAALCAACPGIVCDETSGQSLVLVTENAFVARKYFTLLKKSLKVYIDVSVRLLKHRGDKRSRIYRIGIYGKENVASLLAVIKQPDLNRHVVDGRLCKAGCCRRAALRGYFIAGGSMSSPEKGYHLEIAVPDPETAEQITELMASFSVTGRCVRRKKQYVVYLKEGEGIADFLKVIGASHSLLEFENTRIYKDMRGRINRKVNCEAANITKTVTAAAKQVDDIRLIESFSGIESLSPQLRQIAYLRLEQPSASLEELGQMADPPLGKSGVNHRLRKISLIADKLRQG